ncbi:alpha/beta hydrolase [SAR92 clade bacterium H246]
MSRLSSDFLKTKDALPLIKHAVELQQRVERDHAHFVNVNGIGMGYLDFGPKDAVPLVWAHGSAWTSFEMINVQAGLVAAGYRVIAIDYRGHGKTQIEVTAYNTSIYHVADDIAGLMNLLNIEQAVVGGLSKGAFVATAFYDAYPEKTMGLLLEDGGSWSHLRFKEEVAMGRVEAGIIPHPLSRYANLCNQVEEYASQQEALASAFAVYQPALMIEPTVELLCTLLSLFRRSDSGQWIFHCNAAALMSDAGEDKGKKVIPSELSYFSKLTLMQQSQELLLPLVIFRNLNIPVHIIDPVSPTDWLDVHHQNEELASLHPEWVVHECYEYECSPHEAHLKRPERFIASATQLLERVKCSA